MLLSPAPGRLAHARGWTTPLCCWLAVLASFALPVGAQVDGFLSLFEGPRAAAVSWERSPPGCSGRSVEQLACGALGTYTFGAERAALGDLRAPGCAPLAAGVSVPLVLDRDRDSPEAPGGRACSGCRNTLWSHYDDIATLDWDEGSHAVWIWTVMDAVTDYKVLPYYFFLDHPTLQVTQSMPGVSDFHVLEQLCQVAELEAAPPLMNLSFGRLLDAEPCVAGDSITCEVSRVLAHLHNDRGMLILAAAGNHGELLFPASDPSTIAVGNLDLRRFWPTGNVAPEDATPAGYDALFPGHGLIRETLEEFEEEGVVNLVIPPGSSFATAFLSGWLFEWENAHPGALATLRADDPDLISIALGPGDFFLAADGVPYMDSNFEHIDRVLRVAIGLDRAPFDAETYDGGYALALSEPLAITLPPARPQLTLASNQPTPGSEPCVPCRMRRRASRASGGILEMVLEVGTRAPAAGGVLEDVYLQLGDELYGLLGENYGAFVAGMQSGDDTTLDLDVPAELLDGRPAALVAVFERTSDEELFWDSIPLTVHLDQRDALFASNFEGGLVFWGRAVPE